MTSSVAILGSGTMGAGIAQVAAAAGWTVQLMDVDEPTVRNAIEGIRKRFDRLVEKERMTAEQRDDAFGRLRVATEPSCLADCELVLEAIVEDLDIKTAVLGGLASSLSDDAIIATNTSSLSVTKIGEAIGQPLRTVGMHFFNPAPLMKLVEVISGDKTDATVVDRVATIAQSWRKKVARAADVPGFIVNHVARPYYLEAFRILEDGFAAPAEIDTAMKTLGGFRMGPLELTDLIGQDVNTATTRSVWEQLDEPPLLHPSRLQEQLVADGHLGRKTGRGVYDYSGDKPMPAIEIARRAFAPPPELHKAVDEFVSGADTGSRSGALTDYIFARIVVAIIVQAALAFERGVAEQADIDTALKYGVNYPRGPFEWAKQIGYDKCAALLAELNKTVADDRLAIPASLRVTA